MLDYTNYKIMRKNIFEDIFKKKERKKEKKSLYNYDDYLLYTF